LVTTVAPQRRRRAVVIDRKLTREKPFDRSERPARSRFGNAVWTVRQVGIEDRKQLRAVDQVVGRFAPRRPHSGIDLVPLRPMAIEARAQRSHRSLPSGRVIDEFDAVHERAKLYERNRVVACTLFFPWPDAGFACMSEREVEVEAKEAAELFATLAASREVA
jgi:hypothetical protein